ncbi:MAG: PLP-dependent aminotransferase family protein [Solobacterium sp.]|nr:PLP-dependent aminotransferase family protein [Solobacterium sp.]
MKKKIPAYLELYQQLRNAITDGTYPYGSKLPSKRSISSQYRLSLVTIEHALELLNEEGYIEPKERAGLFVSYRSDTVLPVTEELDAVYTIPEKLPEDSFPFSVIARTIRRVVSEYQEEILVKSPPHGHPLLQNAIATHLAMSRGIHVKPEQILIGSGSEYLYGLLVVLLGRDLLYGVEDPSYETIQNVYRSNGVELDLLKLGNNGIRSEELKRTKADVLHITPFHSWPTGITADASKRREYLDWAVNHDRILIEDDYDSEFTLSGKPADTLFAMEPDYHVIYLNTFSRTIAPSVRIGYMLLPMKWLNVFEEKAGFYSCSVSTFSQLLLYELIHSGDYERHINRIRRNRRRRQ